MQCQNVHIFQIVIAKELREDVNYNIKVWKEALKSESFHLSTSKTKYMKCKLSMRQTNNDLEHIRP